MAGSKIGLWLDSEIVGGAERSALNLLDAYRGPHELVVCAPSEVVVHEARRIRDDRPHTLVATGGSALQQFLAYRRTFASLRLDLVQLTLVNPFAVRAAMLAAVSLRIPVVAVEQLVRPSRRRRGRWLKQASSRVLAGHVAVGHATARELNTYFGIPLSSVTVIHNGIPDTESVAVSFERRPVIGCAARLEDQKQLDVLLRAVATIPDVQLCLVGDGSRRGELEALARTLDIVERTSFVGWVDDARPWIAGFDVFALPSRAEAFPLTIVEAMLAGVPVVATDVGSVSEAVRDGETGLLVRSGDVDGLAAALTRQLDARDDATRLAARARVVAREQFTAEVMAERYAALWSVVLRR